MRVRYIDEEEAAQWHEVCKSLREVDRLLSNAAVLLIKLGQHDGRAYADLKAAEDKLAGLAYNCTPQTEWTGGSSHDPRHPVQHKTRAPHWAVPVPWETNGATP